MATRKVKIWVWRPGVKIVYHLLFSSPLSFSHQIFQFYLIHFGYLSWHLALTWANFSNMSQFSSEHSVLFLKLLGIINLIWPILRSKLFWNVHSTVSKLANPTFLFFLKKKKDLYLCRPHWNSGVFFFKLEINRMFWNFLTFKTKKENVQYILKSKKQSTLLLSDLK